MIQSLVPTIVIDACVLYPAPVRDIILSLSSEGVLEPKWSDEIQQEWTSNLLKKRLDLSKDQLDISINAMNFAFPGAIVGNFKTLFPGLTLPDKNDIHVLACAIKCNANMITTFNLKDFPLHEMKKYSIEVVSPDKLLCRFLENSEHETIQAFNKMVKRLKNPPKSDLEVALTLSKCGLIEFSKQLINILQLDADRS